MSDTTFADCPGCKGKGYLPGYRHHREVCATCNGTCAVAASSRPASETGIEEAVDAHETAVRCKALAEQDPRTRGGPVVAFASQRAADTRASLLSALSRACEESRRGGIEEAGRAAAAVAAGFADRGRALEHVGAAAAAERVNAIAVATCSCGLHALNGADECVDDQNRKIHTIARCGFNVPRPARSLASSPGAPDPRDALAPWYEADGSTVMLPAEEVERRRKLAAKVISAAAGVSDAADLWVIAGTEAPASYDVPPEPMRVLREALDALAAASSTGACGPDGPCLKHWQTEGPAADESADVAALRTRVASLEEENRAMLEALAGLVYCADCWDNPEHNVCEEHLAPARAVLSSASSREGRHG
jgi:hypothetical protein